MRTRGVMRKSGVVLMLALASAGLVGCADDEDANSTPDNQTTSSAETTPSPSAELDTSTISVTVAVNDVVDADGFELAGVLSKGPEPNFQVDNVVGGFSVAVTEDPFSTSQVVRSPQLGDFATFTGPFPWVTDNALSVQPGEYLLQLWLAPPPPLGPYSRWVPAEQAGLTGCIVRVTVVAGEPADVIVNGIPPRTGDPQVPCTTD